MKKYSRKIVDYLKKSNEIKLDGIDSEIVRHFNPTIRFHESTEQEPVVIECFGITNPDTNYTVGREKSHNYVLEYVEEGIGYVEIDGEKFTVKAGDTYLLYPNTKQKYYSDKEHPMKKYWVNFIGTDIDRILDALKIKGVHYFPKCNLMGYFIQLYSLDEIFVSSIDFSYFALSTITSMFVEMKKSLVNKEDENDIAVKIKEIIDAHISENIKVLDICDELMLSKTFVIKTFKDKYHVTPNQYKLNRKMEIARNMLMNENISIKQIAISLGFIDQYHFANSFKKHHNMYPSEYRKVHFKDR